MPIVFDSLVLASVTDELSRTITGTRIEKISQPSELEIVARIYSAEFRGRLLFSCDSLTARVHLTETDRPNPVQPRPFCQLLRKYLEGGRIDAVANPLGFGDRVLHFHIRAADRTVVTLVAELMGRHSNIVLIDSQGYVLGAAKHISHDINRVRETLPGRPYIDPPRQKLKRDPMRGHFPDGSALDGEDEAAEWLLTRFEGVSPLLAREAIARAELPLTTSTLWKAFDGILEIARGNDWTPVVWRDESGLAAGAYPISLASLPADRQRHVSSISAALDEAAQAQERGQLFHQAHTALLGSVRKATKARESDLESVREGLKRSEQAEWLRQSGDLILASKGGLARGEKSFTVDDPYATEPGAVRSIELDPSQDALENAERYFRKSRKARNSKESLQRRQSQLEEAIVLLKEAGASIILTTDMRQLAEIRNGIGAHLNRSDAAETNSAAEPRKRSDAFDGHKIRVFRSLDGYEILVGENATSNDYLTTKIATGSDIWLHVRAAASAHGVIRTNNRPAAVSPATIQQAAEFVAARSESKHASLIPVDYTLKKYVRKPRKSAPGAVFYQNEKTIYVSGIG